MATRIVVTSACTKDMSHNSVAGHEKEKDYEQ